MHLVLNDLDKAKFFTMPNVERHLLTLPQPTAGVSTTDLSDITMCVSLLGIEVFKSEGVVALLRKRVKYLEERRGVNNAVTHDNKIFKDQHAVEAFVIWSNPFQSHPFCFVGGMTLPFVFVKSNLPLTQLGCLLYLITPFCIVASIR